MARSIDGNEQQSNGTDATGLRTATAGNSNAESKDFGVREQVTFQRRTREQRRAERQQRKQPATEPAAATGGYTDAVGSAEPAASGVILGDTEPRRRGRPKGSRNVKAGAPLDISGIEKLLLGIHTTLARVIPEMEMPPDEAHEIASAYCGVAEYYPIMRLPDETVALITFASVVSLSYGTRFAAWRMRMMMQQPAPRPPPQAAPPPTQPPPARNGHDKTATSSAAIRTGEVPGVGNVEFPPDHPLVRGNKLN